MVWLACKGLQVIHDPAPMAPTTATRGLSLSWQQHPLAPPCPDVPWLAPHPWPHLVCWLVAGQRREDGQGGDVAWGSSCSLHQASPSPGLLELELKQVQGQFGSVALFYILGTQQPSGACCFWPGRNRWRSSVGRGPRHTSQQLWGHPIFSST